MKDTTKTIVLAAAALLFIPLWSFVVVPSMTSRYDEGFSYSADVFSVDNFFDEKTKTYKGEVTSKTVFSYDVVERTRDALAIETMFDVQTLQGEPIFSVTRRYSVDRKTGMHTGGGDKERDGYLFAPIMKGARAQVPDKSSFTYWHINYDAPARMVFVATEEREGLSVYRYETTYPDERIDQTANLSYLPGVPEERGVALEPRLTLWIDPYTGHFIDYEDHTTAYYYDVHSGAQLQPWNTFRNTIVPQSVQHAVKASLAQRFTARLQDTLVPLFFALVAAVLILKYVVVRRAGGGATWDKYQAPYVYGTSGIVFIGSIVVMLGWFADIEVLKSVVPGLVTMKFTTALSFFFSALICFFSFRNLYRKSPWSIIVISGASLCVLVLMATLLISSFFGIRTGVENLLVREQVGAIQTVVPGRPSTGTMISFISLSIAGVVTLLRGTKTILKGLGWVIILLGASALVGYCIDMPVLYFTFGDFSSAMAFHTAALFVLLGFCLRSIGSDNQQST